MMTLNIGNIEITGVPDKDNEVEITMTDKIDNEHYQYISKDDAKKIIYHLRYVFDI